MAALILIYSSKCQIWKERSKRSVGSPDVSSQIKQEPAWPEEANVEGLNLAPIYADSPLTAHLSATVTVSPPGWRLPQFLKYFVHSFPLEPSVSFKKIALPVFLRPRDHLRLHTTPAGTGLAVSVSFFHERPLSR